MKSILLSCIIFCIVSSLAKSQGSVTAKTLPDTLILLRIRDDMKDRTIYMPSKEIKCFNETKSTGFGVHLSIESNLTVNTLSVTMHNIGECVENNEIIILFDDDSKFTQKSYNEFNCKGNAYFKVTKMDLEQLSTKKVKKIRVTNGRSFDSFTSEVDKKDQDYFIKFFRMLESKQFFEYKM